MEYITHGVALMVGVILSQAIYGLTLRSTVADIAARLKRVEATLDRVTVVSALPPRFDMPARMGD